MIEQPIVRTQADVEQLWRTLMSPLGFGGCSIWMVMIQHDQPLAQIVEITDSIEPPEGADADGLATVLAELASTDCRFAFLRSRPGSGGANDTDRAWARTLSAACRRAGVPTEVVHLAHDHDVLPIPLDDLLADSA